MALHGTETLSGSFPKPDNNAGPVVLEPGTSGNLDVPGGDFIVSADYSRAGDHLVLTGTDGSVVVVTGWFSISDPPTLVSETGAHISPDLVARLVGPLAPGQYAQTGAPVQGSPIGRVELVEGGATATRTDGTVVTLNQNTPIFQGDVVQTTPGSKLGIVLSDKTTFALGENARMVMNEMVYDPNAAAQGSFAASLLQGAFVFVTGEIAAAQPQNFVVETPFSTIGVRGTKVAVEVETATIQCSQGAISVIQTGTGLSYNVNAGFGLTLPPIGPAQVVQMQIGTMGTAIQDLNNTVSQPLNPFTRNPDANDTGNQGGEQNGPGDTPDDATPTDAQPGESTDGAQNSSPSLTKESVFTVVFAKESVGDVVPAKDPPDEALPPLGTNPDGFGDPLDQPLDTKPKEPEDPVDNDPLPPEENNETPGLTINGTSGNDTLDGGAGNDTLNGGLGDDIAFGGAGNDTYIYKTGDGSDTIKDDSGFDVIQFTETSRTEVHDFRRVNTENDLLITFANGDQITIQDQFNGKPVERIDVNALNDADDQSINIQTGLNGSAGDDLLIGTGGVDTINGGGGKDAISGGSGDDFLNGGSGNDDFLYFRGDGNDTIDGGTDSDEVQLVGDSTINNSWNFTGATVVQQVETTQSVSLSNVERVEFTGGANIDSFNASATTLEVIFDGGAGADSFTGNAAASHAVTYENDAASGGTAGVTVDLSAGTGIDGFGNTDTFSGIRTVRGTAQADNITGNTTDDFLEGFGGNDTINGGGGNDTILGAAGTDNLTGGTGNDTFDFGTRSDGTAATSNRTISALGLDSSIDIVTDFQTGADKVRLTTSEYDLGATSILTGTNFEIIGASYDGTNATSTRFANGQGTLILDSDGRLISDTNGSAAGYTVIAEFQTTIPAAGDFTIT